jgi:serine/threonine protein kinase
MGGAPTLEPGSIFAQDYRIDRLLSEGGQGAVYAATQLSTKRPRALKLMLPELVANAEMKRRFDIEARVGARIDSDHVVEVIASGVDAATGAPWIVMELLEGEELGDRVGREGPLPRADVREILGQLCHALGAAHRASIIHRDLKPDNVYLTKSRQRGPGFMVKVIDFGVARMQLEAKTAAATQTMLGTPLWMAPEQVTPGAPIKPAADVWSLGLIAYYLLTARSFWLTAYEPEASIWRILNEVCVTAMPAASARAREQGCAELLPEGFDGWFARCVDRDQDQRFADADAAYEAFEALFGGPSPRTSIPSPRTSIPSPRTSNSAPRTSDSSPRTSDSSPRTLESPPRTSPPHHARRWPVVALAVVVALAAVLVVTLR